MIATVLIGVVALIHAYIVVLEMVLWTCLLYTSPSPRD